MLNNNANALVVVAANAISHIRPGCDKYADLCRRFVPLVQYLGSNRASGIWSTKLQELKWLIIEADRAAAEFPAYHRDGKPVIRQKTPYE